MRRPKLSLLSVEQLVERFAELAVDQDVALLSNAIREVNKLYTKIDDVRRELKSRPGDQRSALMSLYDHKNMQVRLKAAKATFPIAPAAARSQLEAIAASRWMPQAGDAGMSLY